MDPGRHGSFEGIGAHVGILDEKITIIAPMPDSPRKKQAYDRRYILGLTEIALQILPFLRLYPNQGRKRYYSRSFNPTCKGPAPVTITVGRGVIQIDSVTFQLMPNDIGYIQYLILLKDQV
ncbi:MAG: hypothetical protein CM1200mP15_19960 [Dehalococcoidia bacterium]|nr:MAG: hypothetical protein CM1200mP15_19960 [Dehalococcoidia bacterium]